MYKKEKEAIESKLDAIGKMGCLELDTFDQQLLNSTLDESVKNIYYNSVGSRRKELRNAISPMAVESKIKLD